MLLRHARVGLPLASLLLAVNLSAQEAGPSGEAPEGAFFETVDVNVVNIEVFVYDKKGNPITGLTREDFEVFEDGDRVAVTNFYAVDDGRPVEPDAAALPEASGAPREPRLGDRIPRIPESQRLHLVVYVDNFNIEPFHRNRVFGQLRSFLRGLDRQDRVMLVSYDRSLNIRHRFTDEPGKIAEALFDLEELSGGRIQANNERRDILKAIENADSSSSVLGRTRQHASSVMTDLRFTLDAMRDTISSLAGLPGRKALLYVSDGLPMVPGRDLFFHIQRKFEDMSAIIESQQVNATREFQVLANQANSAGITFYTIDASGLQSLTSGNAENARASTVDGGSAFADSMRVSNLQSSIQYIADRTGGTSIVNANDISRGLRRVAADFKTYYSLGYTPSQSGNGRFHDVEVKVADRKGLRIRHRDGYRDKSVPQRMIERTASSLRHGFMVNPLEVQLGVDAMIPHEKGQFVVPFLVRIPLGEIVLVRRGALYEGRVQVYYTAMDEEGGIGDVQQDPVAIQIPPEDLEIARGKFYTYELRLLMPRGRHIVGVGIRDEYGATASFVSSGIAVGG